MKLKYVLFRIYVHYSQRQDLWAAEGKWWGENDIGVKEMTGIIRHSSFGSSLPAAIDDVLKVAKDMHIQPKDTLRLGYYEKYEWWDNPDEPNPYPKPKYAEKLLAEEAVKRGWTL